MYQQLDILNMAFGLARHSAARQAQIAQNVANADTPGYRAKDIADFAESYVRQTGQTSGASPATAQESLSIRVVDRPGPSDPNGNTVSIETEMLHAIDSKRAHDRAIAVYESSLNILRTSLGRGR